MLDFSVFFVFHVCMETNCAAILGLFIIIELIWCAVTRVLMTDMYWCVCESFRLEPSPDLIFRFTVMNRDSIVCRARVICRSLCWSADFRPIL